MELALHQHESLHPITPDEDDDEDHRELQPMDIDSMSYVEQRLAIMSSEHSILWSSLAAVRHGGSPVCVNLYHFLNDCSILVESQLALEAEGSSTHSNPYSVYLPEVRESQMKVLGSDFQEIRHRLSSSQSDWNIHLRSINRQHFHRHELTFNDVPQPRKYQGFEMERYVEKLALAIALWPLSGVDFMLVLTNHHTTSTFCVLSLFQDFEWYFGDAEAVCGPEGVDLRQTIDTFGPDKRVSTKSCLPIFTQYQDAALCISDPLPRMKPLTTDIQVKEDTELQGHLLVTTRAFNAARNPTQNSHKAQAVLHTGEFSRATDNDNDIYGFTRITYSAPSGTGTQGIIPQESENWTDPVWIQSPGSTSSEIEDPPPPYALSPRGFHLYYND